MLYRHFKGGLYIKLCTATLEANLEAVVVYISLRDFRIWVRPSSSFYGFTDDAILRFSRIF